MSLQQYNPNKEIISSPIDDLHCLTGYARDKEIVARYSVQLPTLTNWKLKTLDDDDSWRRLAYELFVRYVPLKDKYYNSIDRISEKDILRNITTFEIGTKNYGSYCASTKPFKIFIVRMIENTPSAVFKKRVDFLKECITSSKITYNANQ